MPQKRQSNKGVSDPVARSLAIDYERPTRMGRHCHSSWAQVIYAATGVMTVDTEDGSWVVPPQRAVWVPAGVSHDLSSSGALALRTIYLRDDQCVGFPTRCHVLQVSALLRELILEVVRIGLLEGRAPRHRRLVGVILDRLADVEPDPLELRLPRDRRARRVAERLQADPSDARPLDEVCAGAGASKRTVERLFLRETGSSLGRWRQQVRLMHALRLLAGGASVTQVAFDVGYESTSAFVSMFRKALGTTPGRYAAKTG